MTTEQRIAELMGLHKEQLARMIAEYEDGEQTLVAPSPLDGVTAVGIRVPPAADDTAVHDAETAAVAAEVNGTPAQ